MFERNLIGLAADPSLLGLDAALVTIAGQGLEQQAQFVLRLCNLPLHARDLRVAFAPAAGMVGVVSIGNAVGRIFWAWASDAPPAGLPKTAA
jgi:hypothetical protein